MYGLGSGGARAYVGGKMFKCLLGAGAKDVAISISWSELGASISKFTFTLSHHPHRTTIQKGLQRRFSITILARNRYRIFSNANHSAC
jgi:hypothetical protein